MEVSPAGVASNPGEARVKLVKRTIDSPTDDQPPPRQEGEAVAIPCLRQIGNGAAVVERARDQFDAGEVAAIIAADHHLH